LACGREKWWPSFLWVKTPCYFFSCDGTARVVNGANHSIVTTLYLSIFLVLSFMTWKFRKLAE
jgi:hypothetical protein